MSLARNPVGLGMWAYWPGLSGDFQFYDSINLEVLAALPE